MKRSTTQLRLRAVRGLAEASWADERILANPVRDVEAFVSGLHAAAQRRRTHSHSGDPDRHRDRQKGSRAESGAQHARSHVCRRRQPDGGEANSPSGHIEGLRDVAQCCCRLQSTVRTRNLIHGTCCPAIPHPKTSPNLAVVCHGRSINQHSLMTLSARLSGTCSVKYILQSWYVVPWSRLHIPAGTACRSTRAASSGPATPLASSPRGTGGCLDTAPLRLHRHQCHSHRLPDGFLDATAGSVCDNCVTSTSCVTYQITINARLFAGALVRPPCPSLLSVRHGTWLSAGTSRTRLSAETLKAGSRACHVEPAPIRVHLSISQVAVSDRPWENIGYNSARGSCSNA